MEEKIETYYCNACKRWTKHALLFTHTFEQAVNDIFFYKDIHVWYCRGCEDVFYQTTFSSSDGIDENGNLILYPVYYPPRGFIKTPKIFITLPFNLDLLYNEIVKSFNQNGFILSSMGLRALLEGICKDKNISGKSLEKLIDNMDFISASIKSNLHGIRFMGNDSAHELDSFSREEVLIALEIMEDLMNYTYELDYKSSVMLNIMNQKRLTKGSMNELVEKQIIPNT